MKHYFSSLFFFLSPFDSSLYPSPYFSSPIYHLSPCIYIYMYVRPLTICYRVLSWFSFVQPFPPLSFPGSFFHSYLCTTILVPTIPFTAFIILSRSSSASTFYSLFLRTLSSALDFPYFIRASVFVPVQLFSFLNQYSKHEQWKQFDEWKETYFEARIINDYNWHRNIKIKGR